MLLPTRQLVRSVLQPVGHADGVEQLGRPGSGGAPRRAGDDRRDRDVVDRVEPAQQVELLEDRADLMQSMIGQVVLGR